MTSPRIEHADAVAAALAGAGAVAEDALALHREALMLVAEGWCGESGSAATDLLQRQCGEASELVEALHGAAAEVASLRDALERQQTAAAAPALSNLGGALAGIAAQIAGAAAQFGSQTATTALFTAGAVLSAVGPDVIPAHPEPAQPAAKPAVHHTPAAAPVPAPPAAPIPPPVAPPEESEPAASPPLAAERPPEPAAAPAPEPADPAADPGTPCEIAADELPQVG